jgi:hypothetical protein
MQAKDIPEIPILEFLKMHGGIGCNRFKELNSERCVFRSMPQETPEKVGVAKMKSLINRGLVSGCCCGCRGDFHLTALGDVMGQSVGHDENRIHTIHTVSSRIGVNQRFFCGECSRCDKS